MNNSTKLKNLRRELVNDYLIDEKYQLIIEEIANSIDSKIDWKKLSEKYFSECTYRQFPIEKSSVKINMAPHDLFEWFKLHVDSYCL